MSTPSQVIKELQRLIQENDRGGNALYDAEIELADAESELDRIETKEFLSASGTVAERERIARMKANEARLIRDLKKAEVQRIKQKIRAIEAAMSGNQTIAKLIDLEVKGYA